MKYILDTNVLLNNPDFIKDNDVILLPTVLRELESLELKRTNYDMQYRIRKAKRVLKECDNQVQYIQTDLNSQDVEAYIGYESDYGDNIILAYVLCVLEHEDITVYTDDVLLQQKLKSKDIKFISTDDLLNRNAYSGIYVFNYDQNIDEHQQILEKIYQNESFYNPFRLVENQYLIIVDENNNLGENFPIDLFVYKNDMHQKIYNRKPAMRSVHDDGTTVSPLNTRQTLAIHMLNEQNVPVKIVQGQAASGKSFLVFTKALEMLRAELVDDIIVIGNNIPTKGSREIGFLPGDVRDKLASETAYIRDILGADYLLDDLINNEKIRIESVNFLRSRTFNNSVVICTESQNYTIEQLKLILTRIGNNSYLFMDGDIGQCDIDNSGWIPFVNTIKDDELVGVVTLEDIERSEIAELVSLF